MSNSLKRTLFDGYTSMELQTTDILICLLLTTVIAVYIYLIYKQINKNSFYNKNFNMSLVALAIVTAAVILTIQSSIVVSLGMVGALSIVRFRTAIKDPMDLVFLFWSITVGIICGAGHAVIAILSSAIITVVVFCLASSKGGKPHMVLLVNSDSYEIEQDIMKVIEKYCQTYRVKARNLTQNHFDMAIEVKVTEQGELLKALLETEHVYSASLVDHDGDVTV